MRKVMFIEFNPQDKDSTIEAIVTSTSKEVTSIADTVLLKPDSSLISMECLHMLNKEGFYARKISSNEYVFKYIQG